MSELSLSVGDAAYVTSTNSIYKVVVTGISPTGRITTHQQRGDTMFNKTVWRKDGSELSRSDRWHFRNLREADHPEVVQRIVEAKRKIMIGRIEDLIKTQSIEVLEQVAALLKNGDGDDQL